MNIFLDTNIIMDVLVGPSRENYPYSIRILNAIEKTSGLTGLFSVQSLTDIAYSQTKYGAENRKRFYEQAKELLQRIRLVTIKPANANEALWAEPEDFEDYEQILCAEDNDCSWFITGDLKLLTNYQNLPERIPVISPRAFFEMASQKKAD
jgi:predicted nucleic acid-binding protein